MTDKERDPEAIGPADATDEDETADDAELIDETDEADELAEPGAQAVSGTAARGAADAAPIGKRSRDRRAIPTAGAAPTLSEQAVHIDDRPTAVFVIAIVAVFAAILVYGLLLGQKGFISGFFPTPTPIVTPTPAPTATPTATPVPSVTVAPSASASAAPSVTPAASATPAPTATPAASPSPSAS
jgi:hypothetical protein